MTPMDLGTGPDAAPEEGPAPVETAASAEPAPVKKHSLGCLLPGIVFWPRATFAYLRDYGGRSWVLPLLLAALLAVAGRVVAIPIEKAQADAALAAIQSQLDAQGKNGNVKIFTAGGPGGLAGLGNAADPAANPLLAVGLPVLGVIWDWLLRGAVLLGLAWLLGGRPGPGAMFRMSGWTLIPTVARLLVALAVMVVAHREPLSGLQGFDTGLDGGGPASISTASGDNTFTSTTDGTNSSAIQVGPGGGGGLGPSFLPLLRSSFLGALDLYTLWGLLLMLLGVAVTARLGWLKAALSTAGYWAISLVLATLPPLLSFMLITLAGPGRVIGP
jgi:hypothetical protein